MPNELTLLRIREVGEQRRQRLAMWGWGDSTGFATVPPLYLYLTISRSSLCANRLAAVLEMSSAHGGFRVSSDFRDRAMAGAPSAWLRRLGWSGSPPASTAAPWACRSSCVILVRTGVRHSSIMSWREEPHRPPTCWVAGAGGVPSLRTATSVWSANCGTGVRRLHPRTGRDKIGSC